MPWLIAVAALGVVGFVISRRPSTFEVERSTTISASPSDIFPHVNDFHAWDAWSPWAKLDPEMKTTFAGADSGVGARYAWSGNKKVGEGSMEITESHPSELVGLQLEFLKPWKARNTTTFTFDREGDGTRVTWSMRGHNNFVAKAFTVFMDMDKMIGKDFEKGLEQMKAVVEGARTAN